MELIIENYVFLTFKQLSQAIVTAPMNTSFDFTFDQSKEDFWHGEPTGWHGAKITQIFDEEKGVFVIGYYGNGHTHAFDIGAEWCEENIELCIEKILQNYAIENDCSDNLLCVEITENNKQYLEGII